MPDNSRWSERSADHRKSTKLVAPRSGVPENDLRLTISAIPSGWETIFCAGVRGCRCAQPPATLCQPSGLGLEFGHVLMDSAGSVPKGRADTAKSKSAESVL